MQSTWNPQYKLVRKTPKSKTKSKQYKSKIYKSIIPANKVYKFKRTCTSIFGYNNYTGFTSPSGTSNYGQSLGMAFTLQGPQLTSNLINPGLQPMPSPGEFTALFDQYKITGVAVKIIYTNNIANGSAVPGTYIQTALPTSQICVDYDDNVAVASETELLQRPETKILQLGTNGPVNVYVKNPQLQIAVATTAGTSNLKGQGGWVNADNNTASFMGLKWWLEFYGSPPGVNQGYFKIYYTYYISCRGVR